jgi:hypothetical protein
MTSTQGRGMPVVTLTAKAVEKGAKALALALNGGEWDTHYTEKQKDLWRARVLAAMSVTPTDIGDHPVIEVA